MPPPPRCPWNSRPIVFYVFSNGGAFALEQIDSLVHYDSRQGTASPRSKGAECACVTGALGHVCLHPSHRMRGAVPDAPALSGAAGTRSCRRASWAPCLTAPRATWTGASWSQHWSPAWAAWPDSCQPLPSMRWRGASWESSRCYGPAGRGGSGAPARARRRWRLWLPMGPGCGDSASLRCAAAAGRT